MESKHIAIIIVAAIVVVAGIAVALWMNGNQKPPEPEPVDPYLTDDVLVVYFSATGNTADIAERIAEYLDADIYEIVPVVPYTDEDLERENPNGRCYKENQNKSIRPAIAGDRIDLSKYSSIILGFPIWYKLEPNIILTFLESYDVSDMTVIPFCTSWGTGIATAENYLFLVEPDANWMHGRQLDTDISDEDLFSWLDSLKKKA